MRVCETCRLRYDDNVSFCLVDGTELELVSDPRIGTSAGRYSLDEVIGRGGMATVYRAHVPHAERDLAVKVLHERFADDESFRERLEREARSAAQLAHPNIVEVYDSGTTEDAVPFLAMELLEGDPLDQHIKRQGHIAPAEVITLGLQIARGLSRAHDFNVVHRDIKPENIFVCRSDDQEPVVKIVDFGIAIIAADPRLTGTGELLGSPRYMAPERFMDRERVLASSDLYSLGVVLYEMASGRLPFESSSLAGYVVHHMETEPTRLSSLVDVPTSLDLLVHELLAKNPAHRPVDAHSVVASLSAMATVKSRRVRRVTALSRKRGQTQGESKRLGGWSQRAEVYEAMMQRAWPAGAPDEVRSQVTELRGLVGEMTTLHEGARGLESQLADQDERLRLDRERLGHAVQTLAEDISTARANRRARTSVVPTADLARHFHVALERVVVRDQQEERPSQKGLEELQDTVAAYATWLGAVGADGVRDLEFQLEAIHGRLDRIEAEAAETREALTAQLAAGAERRRALESRLLELARELAARFRPMPEVRELFKSLAAS